MANGILVHRVDRSGTSAEFIPLQSRADFDDPDLQKRLCALDSDPAVSLLCGCGIEHGDELPLQLRRYPLSNDDREERVIARESVDLHRPGCFLYRVGDSEDISKVRAASLFGRARTCPGPTESDDAKEKFRSWTRKAYDTWSSYARTLISNAHLTSFESRNRGVANWSQFRTADGVSFFQHLDQAIRELTFQDGNDGYAAAESQGVKLHFGITFEQPPRPDEGRSASWVVWWWDGTQIESEPTMFDGTWATEIAGASTVFGREIEPPYLAIAVVEPDGRFRRICLHAVFFDGETIVPVDSGYERAMAAHLVRRKMAFIKPVNMSDYERLPSAFQALHLGIEKWLFRPDFLVFHRGATGKNMLYIVEVRGFKPNKHPSYDLEWEKKVAWYGSLERSGSVRFEPRNGWDLPPIDQRHALEESAFPHDFGSFSDTFLAKLRPRKTIEQRDS